MLIPKINELLDVRNGERTINREHFYVTDAGSCPRAIYYAFLHSDRYEPLEPRVYRIFDNGDGVHHRITSYLDELKLRRAVEVPVCLKKPYVSGRLDAIIELNGKSAIVEIKSINHYGFTQLREPKEKDIFQLQLYLYMTRLRHNVLRAVNTGIILYEDKNTQELKSFCIRYEPKTAGKLIRFFTSVDRAINRLFPDFQR